MTDRYDEMFLSFKHLTEEARRYYANTELSLVPFWLKVFTVVNDLDMKGREGIYEVHQFMNGEYEELSEENILKRLTPEYLRSLPSDGARRAALILALDNFFDAIVYEYADLPNPRCSLSAASKEWEAMRLDIVDLCEQIDYHIHEEVSRRSSVMMRELRKTVTAEILSEYKDQ